MVTPKVKGHTYIHSDLSLVLNITVRLAHNPEVHAKRAVVVVSPSSLGQEKKGELRASRAPLLCSIPFFPLLQAWVAAKGKPLLFSFSQVSTI